MVAIEALVSRLKTEGISLRLDEGNIRYRAPTGKLTPELREELRLLKVPIIAWLQQQSAEAQARIPALSPQPRPEAIPLSFAQERLWVLDRLIGPSTTYNVLLTARLRGLLDISKLQRCLSDIVGRHEALRTRIVCKDGQPSQVVDPPCAIDLRFTDLSAFPDAGRELRVKEECEAELSQIFDLERGPLLRASLIRLCRDKHVLLIPHHHIISDAWSIGVVLSEMTALYTAYDQSEQSPLPDLPVQYADFALWQRSWLKGELLARQVEYWRELLEDAPGVLELPTDGPRPVARVRKGAVFRFAIPEAAVEGVRGLAKSEQASLFMVLLAAFQIVLARWTGKDDIVVGSPISGRRDHKTVGLVGFFVNTLVFRSRFPAHQSIRELIRSTKANALGNYANQDVPFEKLVEALHVDRDLTRTPIFQVMFSMLNIPDETISMRDIAMEPMASDAVPDSKFDLSLTVSESSSALQGTFEYPADLFLPSTIARLGDYFVRVLSAMTGDADQKVLEVDLIPPAERKLLLETCNQTEASYRLDSCIHQMFEQQALQRPGATAAEYEGQSLSYGELNAEANRLAHHLIERGVMPDDRVAICVERSLAMVVGLLAILKAGGAYVPLDPSYPAERLTQLLNDCSPQLLLSDAAGRQSLGDAMTQGASAHVDLDRVSDECARYSSDNPDPRARGLTPRHLAYVIYTSGSTGHPNGVSVTHEAVVNYVSDARQRYWQDEVEGAVVATPLGFDATVTTLLTSWSVGKPIVLLANDGGKCLMQLLEYFARPEAWLFKLTPVHLGALVDLMDGPATGTRHRVVVGGEQLTTRALLRFRRTVLRNAIVINEYGPTETTVGCATFVSDGGSDALLQDVVPIGRPIANARIYLLDSRAEPVPLGAMGEIYIGGAGVARGYLDRPELTAERFLADPFSPVAHARMYRTGDLARYRSDGNLEFLGRNDQQIKIRGFRIEPGEVEARLSEHPAVHNAVVIAREDRPGDVRLVAYVVMDAAAVTTLALRAHLAGCLPEYMVPAAIVSLNALPLTPNGKIDRKALPAPEGDAFIRQGYAAPEGGTEIALAQLWSDLLGIERIGRHDNFFELGGHSLLAIRLLSRLPQTFGVELPLAALFTHATLASLAAVVSAGVLDAVQPAVSPIEAVSRDAPLPLSYAQQRLWFLAQFDGGSAAYHIPLALRLRGALDVAAWIGSLNALYARHEALRTVFVGDDGVLQVELLPADGGLPLVEHDLQGRVDAAEQLEALCREEVGAAFDLARGPLIRGRLVRLAEDDHVFLLTQHHIVSDGWSLGVMARELAALYTAFAQGGANPLPPLTVQYPDYAAWQRQWLAGERLQEQTDYWCRALADAPVRLELPTDRPRPAQQSFAGASVPVHLSAELTRDLKQLSHAHGVTLFMTLLAAWATVLARLSGQHDLIIGSPTANRGRRELEPLIGFFVNTLALRIDFSGAPSGAELLARVRFTALDAQEHQDLPFEQVVEIVQPPRHLDHTPLFQVMFAWQNNDASIAELPGLSLEAAEMPFETVKFDLELSLGETDGTIVGGLSYASALFDGATIERYRCYLLTVLQALVDDVDQPVARIDLLPAAERALLLDDWNPAVAHPVDSCIHQMFEQQALQRPGAIAAEYDGQSLSYGELNAQANRLAHHLIERGVMPDDRVAICVERSLSMVVGLLAILKAGGAYVPLDPSYPAERLTQLLNDCSPQLLLSDAAGRQSIGDAMTQGASAHVDLDRVSDECAGYSSDNPDPRARGLTPHHLAYVIYTSGSTGHPKGVMVEHAQVVRLFEATRALYDFDETDTWCLFHSFAFDFSVWEMWGAWRYGGRLLIVPRDVARSADDFYRLTCTAGVTVLNQTPGAFRGFIEASARAGLNSALRYVIFGGEALEPAMLKAWYAHHPDSSPRLINMYGITETTVHVTFQALDGSNCTQPGSPIGRPISDLRVYLLDPLGQPVPLGAVGELHVGGAGVARGYLNRPDLTAERFVNDPFSTAAGARMYRSGDLARYLPDGRLEFFGRNDQQVKIRGFRIELGEIETQLAEHPWVKEALVRAVEDDAGDKRLTAYVVLQADAHADELVNSLRTYLARRLPDHMVPAAYLLIPGIPLTAHGKLDTTALPRPDGTAFARRQYEPPRSTREKILCDVWSNVMQVGQVGVNDNFFEIGGDSILSLKIVRLARASGLELSVTDIFRHQTIAGLAQAAQHFADDLRIDVDALQLGEEVRRALPPAVEDAYPLTAMQALMVAEYDRNRDHGLGIYHVQQCFQFKDVRPSADAMHDALKLLIAEHAIFRTALIRVGGATVQGIASADAFTFEFVDEDLRACSQAESEARVGAYVLCDRGRAFADASLLRFAWFRTAEDTFVLIHSIHHAIDDGWGNQQFLNQLFETYLILRNGGTPMVEAPSNVFREYVALQLELAGSEDARAFWASRHFPLCGVDTLRRHYGRQQNRNGSMMTIDSITTGKLRAAAKGLGVSLKAVLLGAYLEAIKCGARVASPTVGVIVNGRSDRLSDPLGSLGLFWNMLPFGHDRWIADRRERARAIQRELPEMERYAAFPHSGIENQRGSAGLFFATFNYVDFHNASSLPANEGIELTRVYGHDKFHYPLNYAFSVNRSTDEIGVYVQHDDEYFDSCDVHALNVTLLDLLGDYGAS